MNEWPEFAEMTKAQQAEIRANVAQIQRLCRLIETPAQFDAIMEKVQDDQMRHYVRTLCEPMLKWTKRSS